jgi:hypothetical protein
MRVRQPVVVTCALVLIVASAAAAQSQKPAQPDVETVSSSV